MGRNDYCAIYGCGFEKRPCWDSSIAYSLNISRYEVMGKMLNRQGGFKMTMSTKVCTNHFAAGYCSDVSPIPTIFLKGYISKRPLKRKVTKNRNSIFENVHKKVKFVVRDGFEVLEEDTISTPFIGNHSYDNSIPTNKCARCTKKQISELKHSLTKAETKKSFIFRDISHSDKRVRIYTGLQNAKLFEWLHKRIDGEAKKLNCYNQKTTQKHRINLSNILNTWIPFMSLLLKDFIHWLTKKENKNAFQKCFEKFPNVIGIIDCAEGALEIPSLAKAQVQTYSTYKSKNTWKVLLCVTPIGTVSFISKAYGGNASDQFITERSGILDKIVSGGSSMAYKGFNISDLLVGKG
ncbi:uncharacterized protein LOC136083362 [Hydra vulgaris]|uniref:Uncharacterized protein LOC136083362 n=1 Tax=Hydra vulgaris TaxID=6087 RepID=A0ABM4CAZ2_HYDVU